MSGFLKPASSPMKRLSETRFTEHTRLTETRRCKSSWSKQTSVSWNINSRTAFGKICRIRKCFHRSSFKIKIWISGELRSKKCKNHKRSYRKYWFNFLNTKIESNIWWDCTFKSAPPQYCDQPNRLRSCGLKKLRNCDCGPSKFDFRNSATLRSLLPVPLLFPQLRMVLKSNQI